MGMANAVDRLELQFFGLPSTIHKLVRCAVDALVGNFPDPLPQLAVEVLQARGFTTLKPTQEVPAHVLYAGLDLPFRLGPIRPAKSRPKPQYRAKSVNTGCQTISPRSSVFSHTVFIQS